MFRENLITTEELAVYGQVENPDQQAMALIQQQKDTWELARKNYAALAEVQTRSFNFGHFTIHAHHNPGRMRSSAAKTDAHTIAQRPCFLCAKNLPPEQKGIAFGEKYIILANPFPIFPSHLTIVHRDHIPQLLIPYFSDMVELSRILPGFTLFYNGPSSGASAPDHFHFQAGNKGFLPVEKELEQLKKNHALVRVTRNNVEIVAVENYLRRFIALGSSDKDAIIGAFQDIIKTLSQDKQKEPMLNVLSFFRHNQWQVIVFPRHRQRPSHFFRKGNDQLIVGPAAVEMGGVLILPDHNNFESISQNVVSEIYAEVTIPKKDFNLLIERIIH